MMNILTFSLPKSEHILHLLNLASRSNVKYCLLSVVASILAIAAFWKPLNDKGFLAKHNKMARAMTGTLITLIGIFSVSTIVSGIMLNVNSLWMTDTEARYIEYNCAEVPQYQYLRKNPFVKRLFKESKDNDLMHSPIFDYKYHHKMPHQVTKVSWWQYL